jgi:hypothetical protein
MKKLYLIILLILSAVKLFPQTLIDSSEYYPLQNGDHWEYIQSGSWPSVYFFDTAIGDTTMNNGKTYKIIERTSSDDPGIDYSYYRNEGKQQYKYFGDSISCPDREYIKYDFATKDSSLWPVCFHFNADYRTCSSTFNNYIREFDKTFEAKEFLYVAITNGDTIYNVLGTPPEIITKNIGLTSVIADAGGYYTITGALINGIKYGTFVGIKNENERTTKANDVKLDIYPNPFNNSTKISFSLPRPSKVTLKIFNIIGEEVWKFNQGEYTSGDHQIYFNSSNLGSGLYILNLKTETQNLSKKIIILK